MKRNFAFIALHYVDLLIQFLLTATVSIAAVSDLISGEADLYLLYGLFFLGVHQLFSALVRTIYYALTQRPLRIVKHYWLMVIVFVTIVALTRHLFDGAVLFLSIPIAWYKLVNDFKVKLDKEAGVTT